MSSLEDRVRAFEEIRNQPYRIDYEYRSRDRSCVTKVKGLKAKLEALNLASREIFCTFKWSSTPFLPEIIARARGHMSDHFFLEVRIPETQMWVAIDPSWDPGLRTYFPVATWDGLNGTVLGVKTEKIYSPDLSKKYMRLAEQITLNEVRPIMPFIETLNGWLEQVRRLGSHHA